MITDELDKINRQIDQLSKGNQLLFGITVAESFFQNYINFSTKANWGNPKVLSLIIYLLKLFATGNIYRNGELLTLNELLYENMPDMDDFGGDINASIAVDCCSMIGECIDFIEDSKAEHVKTIAYVATQSIEFFVADKDDIHPSAPDFDNHVFNSKQVQSAFSLFSETLDFLLNNQELKIEEFEKLHTTYNLCN